MKKLICLFASAALLGACEQQTEVAAPATPAPATPAQKSAEADSAVGPKPTLPPGADSFQAASDAKPVSTATPSP